VRFITYLKKLRIAFNRITGQQGTSEQQLLTAGKLLSDMVKSKQNISSFSEVEFKIFSQWGDDGIIQWLISRIEFSEKSFVEFGVEDYRESNTRFLMMNDNWSGLIMDGSKRHISKIVNSEYFWKYSLSAKKAFITVENINALLSESRLGPEIGILHIDLDGNDYWIWKEISAVNPILVILEYNSVFGKDRKITVPYSSNFSRTDAHSSNLYYGASLAALHSLSSEKGYAFLGCNSAGNNAYFVRTDKLNDSMREVSLEAGYVASKFRESRNGKGERTYKDGEERLKAIKGLPVYNIENDTIESL
jgi:hypothetical protein